MIGFSGEEYRSGLLLFHPSFQFWPARRSSPTVWREDFLAHTATDHPMPIKSHGNIRIFSGSVVLVKTLNASYQYEAPQGGVFTYTGTIQTVLAVASIVSVTYAYNGQVQNVFNLASVYNQVRVYTGVVAKVFGLASVYNQVRVYTGQTQVVVTPSSVFSHLHTYNGITIAYLNCGSAYQYEEISSYFGYVQFVFGLSHTAIFDVVYNGQSILSLLPNSLYSRLFTVSGYLQFIKTLNANYQYEGPTLEFSYTATTLILLLAKSIVEAEGIGIPDETKLFKYYVIRELEMPEITGDFRYNIYT